MAERKCAYCNRDIVEGQHFIRLTVELDTDMPPGMYVRPTIVTSTSYDTVHCARNAGFAVINRSLEDERVQDTFDPRHG